MELVTYSRDMGNNFEKNITLTKRGESLLWRIIFSDEAPATANISVRLTGKNASCRIACIYAGIKTMRSDITMNVEHAAPDTTSRVSVLATVDDMARIAWRGTVLINKKAVRADAALTAKALLLSDNAMAFFKPDLEILHDEVRVTHGASVGRINPKDLFYFTARGIAETKAKHMIAQGFLRDTI